MLSYYLLINYLKVIKRSRR